MFIKAKLYHQAVSKSKFLCYFIGLTKVKGEQIMSVILNEKIFLTKFKVDSPVEVSGNNGQNPWIAKLMAEFEEHLDEEDLLDKQHWLKIESRFLRKKSPALGEYLLFDLKVDGQFYMACCRCLAPLKTVVALDVKNIFMPQEKADEESEETTVFVEGCERELYLLSENGEANIGEVAHEQCMLEIPAYPKCEGECQNQVLF